MPKNKKPRKRHIPYRANLNPLAVLQQASIERMTPDKLTELQLLARSSWEELCVTDRASRADRDTDIQRLAIASNIALVLCEGGLGTDHLGVVKEAQAHIAALAELWSITPPHLRSPTQAQRAAITSMLDLHDLQIAHEDLTEGRMVAALREIQYRINNGHAKEIP